MGLAAAMGLCGGTGCERPETEHPTHVIVLGFDGMDPKLCQELMAEGRLPNLSNMARDGSFRPLATSNPPQSPVAWTTLMTGVNPGMHGVFDFVHRDPKTMMPFSSAAETVAPKPLPLIGSHLDRINAFGYRVPLRSAEIRVNRHAPPFWERLTRAGVPVSVYRMPANYPPTASPGASFCCLSDMGTVDLLNTLGTFTYFTSDPAERDMKLTKGGGRTAMLIVSGDRADGVLVGPVNDYLAEHAAAGPVKAQVPFSVFRDPVRNAGLVRIKGRDVVLNVGEWSDWQPVSFEMMPHLASLRGMCRFYLKQLHPHVKLYVSPINFDPRDASWQIDQPADFSVTVSEAAGRYYTQGLPEDTKALSNGILSRDEFLMQAKLVLQERLRLLDFAMDRYRGGLLFFYFGTLDQVGHMFWAMREPDHPAVTGRQRQAYRDVLPKLYERMDAVVGRVAARFPKATILVLSDHGFCSYRRTFHLNTWLVKEGFAVAAKPKDFKRPMNFDFSRTRAYGVGINGLYLNLAGRESKGVVPPAAREHLLDELVSRLEGYRDPATGARVVERVYRTEALYSGPSAVDGPDLIVGYAAGYRGSGRSGMGAIGPVVIEDNTDAWCGDHCVAPNLVPGVLFCNRAVAVDDPSLIDVAPTVLGLFGLKTGGGMPGRELLTGADGTILAHVADDDEEGVR